MSRPSATDVDPARTPALVLEVPQSQGVGVVVVGVAVVVEVAAVEAITEGAGRVHVADEGTTLDQDPGRDQDPVRCQDPDPDPAVDRDPVPGNATRRAVQATSALGSATPIPLAAPVAAHTGEEVAPDPPQTEGVASKRRPHLRQWRPWVVIA